MTLHSLFCFDSFNCVFKLMQEVNSAFESVSLSIIHVLKRSKHLSGKDQYALIAEFDEWIVNMPPYEEIYALPDMTNKKFDLFS